MAQVVDKQVTVKTMATAANPARQAARGAFQQHLSALKYKSS